MPTLTNVQGNIYSASGTVITTGKIYITLQQDIISVDGTKVAPSTVTVDLAVTSGTINVNLYATEGATPGGIYYLVEYDPTPTDTTKPMRLKDGYWRNYWSVPNTASVVSVGSFSPIQRRGEIVPPAVGGGGGGGTPLSYDSDGYLLLTGMSPFKIIVEALGGGSERILMTVKDGSGNEQIAIDRIIP